LLALTVLPSTRLPLVGTDLYDWVALRRVSAGGTTRMGDHWFDHGRLVPGYVADALTTLCDNGLVAVATLDVWGMQRAALTGAGTARYQQLGRHRQSAHPLPVAGSAQAVTWLADHPHACNVVQSVWDALAELEQAGHHPGAIAALRGVLGRHQPTPAGRCRSCRRRFPCVVWHQIRGDLQSPGCMPIPLA